MNLQLLLAFGAGFLMVAAVLTVLIVVFLRHEREMERLRAAASSPAGQPNAGLESTHGDARPNPPGEPKLAKEPFSYSSQMAVRERAEAIRRAKHRRDREATAHGVTN